MKITALRLFLPAVLKRYFSDRKWRKRYCSKFILPYTENQYQKFLLHIVIDLTRHIYYVYDHFNQVVHRTQQ